MGACSAFLKRKNIVLSAKRYGVDALGAMAQGLFCSLLIGTIIKTLGQQLGVPFLVDIGGYASAMSGPAMAAAICAAFGLTGLAGGAAVAGCCAQMVGFAVLSFRENRWGGLVSQGIGTSMLQMPNIVRNPRIWLPAIVTSAITGPIATCVFRLEMNDPAGGVASGMGTCGLVGQIGVYAGWVSDVAAGIKPAITAFDWAGLVLVCFILPAVLCWALGLGCRRLGWIKEGDLTLS